MEQVLFWIPIYTSWTPNGIPVYGFGAMLFCAFVSAAWVAGRRAKRVGIPADKLQDLMIIIFIAGMVGGRILFCYLNDLPLAQFFQIWNGGIVFYGGAIGGTLGGVLAYRRMLKPLGISVWMVADVLAPAIAVGLCFGRIGCFLNGCCFGHVAAPDSPAVCFPALTAPARDILVGQRGQQSLAGFVMAERGRSDLTVGAVEPESPAAKSGLQAGDEIVAVNAVKVASFFELERLLRNELPRGMTTMAITVRRGDQELELAPFSPRLIGLYPTQIYESISAFLMFLALSALYPIRKYDGQVMAFLMMAYAVHRFVNESLRDDTPLYYWFTISQWISFGMFAAGLLMALWRRHHPRTAG